MGESTPQLRPTAATTTAARIINYYRPRVVKVISKLVGLGLFFLIVSGDNVEEGTSAFPSHLDHR